MVVALLVLRLVELMWHRWVAVSSSVVEGWLAGVSWMVFGSVGVAQLELCGDVEAGAVGIRS